MAPRIDSARMLELIVSVQTHFAAESPAYQAYLIARLYASTLSTTDACACLQLIAETRHVSEQFLTNFPSTYPDNKEAA